MNLIPEVAFLNWGILAVYSCENSCHKSDNILIEELVFQQKEVKEASKDEIEYNK